MSKRNGFSLMEVLIAMAVIGILAAVGIPMLVRARVAANESATLGDIRTIISAQAAYRAANSGFYDGRLACLTAPSVGCIPSYPANGPTFLDSQLASQNTKAGYNRSFTPGPGPAPVPANASPTSVLRYRYDATPVTIGLTGVRGFAGASDNRVCFTADGAPVAPGLPGQLPANCADVR